MEGGYFGGWLAADIGCDVELSSVMHQELESRLHMRTYAFILDQRTDE